MSTPSLSRERKSPEEEVSDQGSQRILVEDREELGTGIAEASAKVYGKYSIWVLYITLGLSAYVYSLDQSTTYFYTAFATSSFSHHSLLSSIEVATLVILATVKPVIARIADLKSRSFAYVLTIICYILGYILIASSKGVSQFAAGRVFQAFGAAGLSLMLEIIVADFTALKWRGVVAGLMYSPFIVNAFVGSKIAASITTNNPSNGWRWGYAMFSILIPVSLAPVLFTLLWGERKAKRLGVVDLRHGTKTATIKGEKVEKEHVSLWSKVVGLLLEMDILGLLLLATGWALLLVALTLSAGAKGGWNNPSIIAMIVLGPIIIVVFAIYEIFWAPFPMFPRHILRNRATPAWSLEDQNYFSSTQTVGLTVFGLMAGVVMRVTKRYKWLLVIGLCIRVLGVGIMIRSRGADGSDGELVMTQVLQALGGGIASLTTSVAAQASVPHKYVAMVSAIVFMIAQLGGAIGSSVAGAIWTHVMPSNLRKYLPSASEEELQTYFGSIISIVALEPNDPTRLGVIRAYGETMKILIIVALAFGIIPIFIALVMPDFHLGDGQNAVDGLDIAGRRIEEPATEKTNRA
ncbi:SubName: Full=Related to major facilitator MirA {ECO:0000313/EMBL:CCA74161.1} [Serendipita indica DSM 11827]|nr:SubName: Full=Related to major facilitator MirA {ECO:0000313/EMBL:CCA74161.1} [Serendipita indica DSM 11827]